MTKIINLFAGPGAGKSTTASGVFYKLKLMDKKSELVQEYPKDLTWEQAHSKLSNPALILGEQVQRQQRLLGQVDYVITDAPLITCLAYVKVDYPESFSKYCVDLFKTFENVNFFIERRKQYFQYGRNQTEGEAKELDDKVKMLLHYHSIPYTNIIGSDNAADDILLLLGV